MLHDEADVGVSELDEPPHNVRFLTRCRPVQHRSETFEALQGESVEKNLFAWEMASRSVIADADLAGEFAQRESFHADALHHRLTCGEQRRAKIAVMVRLRFWLNVSSGLALVPFTISPVYSAAKASLHAYTRCLRAQMKGTSVRVVELLPPGTETPLFRGEFEREMKGQKGMDVAEVVKQAIAGIEAGRDEIRPGLSKVLGVISRLAPNFMMAQMARMSAPKNQGPSLGRDGNLGGPRRGSFDKLKSA